MQRNAQEVRRAMQEVQPAAGLSRAALPRIA